MSEKFTALNSDLYRYMVEHRSAPDPILAELMVETEKLGPVALMQISAEQGALMTLLTRAVGARSAVEVGTFTGYSALCVARGLPDDGRLLCCDLNGEWTSIGKRHWKKAGVDHKIDLRLAPALETLCTLPATEQFDIAFIDADKVNYANYYEEILKRLRQNGLILFDNVLWMGQVINSYDTSEDTQALRQLNDALAQDARVEAVMLPISDGLTIVRKR